MNLSNELSIQPMNISQIISLYIQNKLIVNRKYQRKLCWTIEEKRNFIDTIQRGLPVPLFLFAKLKTGEFEIIDGLQRLDAICSFVFQKFSLKDGYYNIEAMPQTIALKKENKLEQKSPVIDFSVSNAISIYPLSVSIFPNTNNETTEEIFKRINSTGRHLSLQELRQVGVNTQFATLVRQISSEIRGDISEESLYLNQMSNISLSNHRLPYTIMIDNIFWVKNGIINKSELRQSRDEEAVAFLIWNMILPDGEKRPLSNDSLNKFYGYSPNPLDTSVPIEMTQINNAIDRIGVEQIKKQFNICISCMSEMIETSKSTFRKLIGGKSNISDLIIPFQIIYMAIHKLIIKEHKSDVNYSDLVKKLSGNCNRIFDNSNLLKDNNSREQAIDSIYGLIQSAFSKGKIEDPALDDWTQELVNIINKSRTEQLYYDFKIGLVPFRKQKIDSKIIKKILKTLTAINNSGPNRTGYIIVGIADNEDDAKKYKTEYGTDYSMVSEFPICGIENDLKACNKNIDEYTHSVKEMIKTSNCIKDDFKTHILSNMRVIKIYEKHVIVFKNCSKEPVVYLEDNGDQNYYMREFTDVNKATGDTLNTMFKSFYKK